MRGVYTYQTHSNSLGDSVNASDDVSTKGTVLRTFLYETKEIIVQR
jgi:hypothetical protein